MIALANHSRSRSAIGVVRLSVFTTSGTRSSTSRVPMLHLAHLGVNLVADRHWAFHHARPGRFARHANVRSSDCFTRLRVIATQTEVVKLQNLDGARSAFSASSRACITLCFFALIHVNEVDHDDAAEIAQNLSNTLMASRFVFRIVSSRRAVLPTYLPVLMSMATRASVWLTTIDPPDLSQTFDRSALVIPS